MPKKRSVNDEVVIASYKITCSTIKTAAELGIGQVTVTRALDRHGIERTGLDDYRASMGSKWEGKQYPGVYTGSKTDIIEWYKAGESLKAIAERIGRSVHVVHKVIQDAGISRPFRARGAESSNWINGRTLNGQGYWMRCVGVDNPMASMRTEHGYVLEHRLVMARKLGRPLRNSETVHHIDGNRANNVPENLELRNGKHGAGVALVCLDCGSHNVGHRKLS